MGVKVNAQTKKGCTALHWVAGSDSESPAIIATLIYHSAKVNLRAKDGRTPLHLASIDKSPTTIALLLATGAKVNIKGKNGWTPLHIAAEYPEVIEALAQEGASTVRDKHGYLPYDYLVENPNVTTKDNIYWILDFGRY